MTKQQEVAVLADLLRLTEKRIYGHAPNESRPVFVAETTIWTVKELEGIKERIQQLIKTN